MGEMIEFCGDIIKETERAILFREQTQDKWNAVWLPLSQINIINKDTSTDPEQAEIEIAEWLAKEKELI